MRFLSSLVFVTIAIGSITTLTTAAPVGNGANNGAAFTKVCQKIRGKRACNMVAKKAILVSTMPASPAVPTTTTNSATSATSATQQPAQKPKEIAKDADIVATEVDADEKPKTKKKKKIPGDIKKKDTQNKPDAGKPAKSKDNSGEQESDGGSGEETEQ